MNFFAYQVGPETLLLGSINCVLTVDDKQNVKEINFFFYMCTIVVISLDFFQIIKRVITSEKLRRSHLPHIHV